jgi:hypothetical protein
VSTLQEIDANMIPGQTYTFKLSLDNWVTKPSTSKLQQDLMMNAPTFVDNDLQVTYEDPGFTIHVLTNIYDIQFTYSGDGSDVISDVAASIVSAIKAGSNDDFTFIQAYAASSADANTDPSGGILDQIIKPVTDAITKTTDKLGQQASKTTQDILTPIEIAVGIVVILVIAIIFTAGKSGGASVGPTGASVGGH